MRFKRGRLGSALQALSLAALSAAIVGFAAVAMAASGSSSAPPPIPCVKGPLNDDEPPVCPVQGQTVVIGPVSGVVFFTAPGDTRRRLDEAHTVPITTIIDARRGRYRLTADQRSVGIRFATADFYGGSAEVLQGTSAKNATVNLQLVANLSACGSQSRAGAAARKHRNVGHLWGSGKGHFGISGQYASAIVQGTKWLVNDYCDGSAVNVRRGTVAVKDFGTGQTVLVHAGHSYFAPATPTFVFPTSCPKTNVPLGSVVTISGTFTPPNVSPAPQVDYTPPSGTAIRHTLQLDPAGNFTDHVTASQRGVWAVSVHLANAAPGGTPASCSFVVT